MPPKCGEIWKHVSDDKIYRIVGVGEDIDSGQMKVILVDVENGKMYVRLYNVFMDTIGESPRYKRETIPE